MIDKKNEEILSNINILNEDCSRILIKLKSDDGIEFGGTLDVGTNTTIDDLNKICTLYNNDVKKDFCFFIKDHQIYGTLLHEIQYLKLETESIVEITCRPKSDIIVRPVTRCTSSLPGHTGPVISVSFSADSKNLASGSGDKTVRLWDISTETPFKVLEGHKDWVLAISWSPICHLLATGDKLGVIIIWDPFNGKPKFTPLKSHKNWITCICWEPLHLYNNKFRFISSSKDGTLIIWNADNGQMEKHLSSHLQCVTFVKWSNNLIFSSSQDLTVRVWDPDKIHPVKTLKEHAHWVNYIAINNDYTIRSSCYEENERNIDLSLVDKISIARRRYSNFLKKNEEMMVSCSDDHCMILWKMDKNLKFTSVKLCGHTAPINHVQFSPDCRFIASASFDKSIKLWNGQTGIFIANLHGHVSRVYQICWSSDSRYLCSASADSTLKIWNVTTRKIDRDLPGHSDEVYAIDWSIDGHKVASAGKDTFLRIWCS